MRFEDGSGLELNLLDSHLLICFAFCFCFFLLVGLALTFRVVGFYLSIYICIGVQLRLVGVRVAMDAYDTYPGPAPLFLIILSSQQSFGLRFVAALFGSNR